MEGPSAKHATLAKLTKSFQPRPTHGPTTSMERPAGTSSSLVVWQVGRASQVYWENFQICPEKIQICPGKCSDLFGKIFRFVRENRCVSTRAGKSSLLGKAFFVSAVDADADE